MAALTKRLVDSAKATDADTFVWDDTLPGFGVRVKASGAKSFLIQYRNRNGRSRRLTLGRYGVLTVEEARKEARLALADVARGADPVHSRKAERGAMTVETLCREYLDRAEKGLLLTRRGAPKKASTLYVDRGRVDRHIVPLIGSRTVKDLTSADLRKFMNDVIAGKSKADVKTGTRGRAIVTGGKGTAARAMGLLGSILTYAVNEGYRADNPVRGIIRPADQTREWRLDDAGYGALGKALTGAEAGGERWQAVMAIRAIALTGCRRGEIEGLLKSEIDDVASALRLGDTKTGKSIRPIGAAALKALLEAADRSKSKFVFPAVGDDKKHYVGLPKVLARIGGKSIPGITAHGLRHSFASTAEDLGYSLPTIKGLLGHAGSSVTEGYLHKIDTALVAAATRIAEHINFAMTGRASKKVVNLRSSNSNRRG
jgi:integrase